MLLVLTMLFSSMIFITGGAGVTAAAESDSGFTPTATIASCGTSDSSAIYGGGSDSSNRVTHSIANTGTDYVSYKVTRADGTDYFELLSATTGAPANHTQWNFNDKNGEQLYYDADNNRYYVYELDIATESTITAFSIVSNPQGYRTSNSSGTSANYWGGFSCNSTTSILTANLNIEAGEFVHISLIIDVNNNMMYLYINNELYTSLAYTASGNHEAWKAQNSAYLSADNYYYDYGNYGMKIGFKLQAHSSYKVNGVAATNVTAGETTLMDNAYLTLLDSTTEGNIAEVLGSDLSAWTGNRYTSDYDVPAVPDIAEIDGVKYNNIADIDTALSSDFGAKDVEILRDSKVNFTINCNANVTTNGYSNYEIGADCTASTSASGNVTVTAPFKELLSVGDYVTSSSTMWDAVKYVSSDNLITGIGALSSNVTGGWGSVGARQTNIVTNLVTGATIMHESANGTLTGSNEFLQYTINNGTLIEMAPTSGKNTYGVLEFDFNLAVKGNGFAISYVHRADASGSTSGPWADAIALPNYVPVDDIMHHVTIIYNYQDNCAYIYVDGAYSGKYAGNSSSHNGAVMKDTYFENYTNSGTAVYLQCIRFGSNNSSEIYMDNVYFNVEKLDTANDGIASVIAAGDNGDITDWDGSLLNDESYTPTQFPPSIAINKVPYYDLTEAEAALVGNERATVYLYDDITTSITINCPAIVYLNGKTLNYTLGSGLTAEENSGRLIITGTAAEVSPNLTITNCTDASALVAAVQADVEGNLFNSIGLVSMNQEGARGTYLKQSEDGTFTAIYEKLYSGETTINSYSELQINNYGTNGVFGDDTKYFVADFDIALDDLSEALQLEVNVRSSSSGLGKVFEDVNQLIEAEGIGAYEFSHITIVGDISNRIAHLFINGNKVAETEQYSSDVTLFAGIRFAQKQDAAFTYDNVAIRFLTGTSAAEAIETGNLIYMDENIYTMGYIFPSEYTLEDTTDINTLVNAVQADVEGNLFNYIGLVSMNQEGARGIYLKQSTDGTHTAIHEKLFSGETTINSYTELQISGYVTNGVFGDDTKYFVTDFDIALDDLSEALQLEVNVRTSGGTSGRGKVFYNVNQLIEAEGIGAYEFSHITIVGDVANRIVHLFINGNKVAETEQYNSDAVLFAGIRLAQKQDAAFTYDNVAIRFLTDTSAANAIATGDLSNMRNSLHEYNFPKYPTVATVDGVEYSTYADLEAALVGGSRKTVVFAHVPDYPIPVNCDAIVKTFGWDGCVTTGGSAKLMKVDGSITYFDGESESNVSITEMTTTNFSASYTSGESLITGVSEANSGSYTRYQIESDSESGTYYAYVPTGTLSSGNTFINVVGSKALTANSYSVFEMDIATQSRVIDNIYVAHIVRGSATGDTADKNGVYLRDYIDPSEEWSRLTVIADYAGLEQHVFVNGVYVFTQGSPVDTTKLPVVSSADTISAIRVNIPGSRETDPADSLYFDNFSLKVFDDDSTARIEESIAAKSLDAYYEATGKTNTRQGEKITPIANINGTDYGNIYNINYELMKDKSHVVYMESAPIANMSIKVSSDTVIALNGVDSSIFKAVKNHASVSDGSLVYINLSETNGNVQIIINGVTVYNEAVAPGTNIADLLEEYGSYGDQIVVCGGYIFTDVTWETAPGVVDGPVAFIGTGTQFTGKLYVHTDGVKLASYTDADSYLATLLKTSSVNYSIILNGNVTAAAATSVQGTSKSIYLNGYTLTMPSGNHGFQPAWNGIFNITGPGTFSNTATTSTQALIYMDYSCMMTVTLKNMTIELTQALGQVRGGNLVIDNCVVNAKTTGAVTSSSSYGGSLFVLGSSYNAGYTYYACNLSIYDSKINFTHNNPSSDVPMIDVVCMGNTDKDGAALYDEGHTVIIDGSEIIAQGSLLQANKMSIYTTMYTTETLTEEKASNFRVNVKDSELIASKLYAGSICLGSINFYDNVSVGATLASSSTMSKVTIADGLKCANTNNYLTPVLYTDDYATVNWIDGSTEYWANGTYPVNGSDPRARVEKVEGGKTYEFLYSFESNPYSGIMFNLTLSTSIGYNIYVPYASRNTVQGIEIAGNALESTVVKINDDAYICYTYELDPIDAVSAFDVVIHTASGTVARKLSVASYASALIKSGASDESKALASSMLNYLKSAAGYFGLNADTSDIDAILESNAAVATAIPTSTADATAIASSITSAQLNIMSTFRMRFNLADGVDATAITVSVNGSDKDVLVGAGYIEVELHAYEMAEMLTITVDGNSGTYDLAKYLNTIDETITSATSSSRLTTSEARVLSLFRDTHGMSSAIYSYAAAAKAYYDTLATA